MSEVTQIIDQIQQGDPLAADRLLPLIYDELRKLASQRLSKEKPGQTIQATSLVHDAYLRLVDVENVQQWDSKGHFFSAAAEAMRRILIERARMKQRVKHGGGFQRVELTGVAAIGDERSDELIALDEALTRFAQVEPLRAELVKLRYFAGLTIEEAAEALEISRSTAKRHWTFARAWLLADLEESRSP